MTSTIKVNNIQNQCGANIINENSNTITIGASGDTIALASGASQSGFGRTGTVDWQTSIKTSTITAVNGEGYFVNTTGGAITANLPAGVVGEIVSFKDYAQTFDTNALTISANGSEKIEGQTFDLILDTKGSGVTLVYGDATKGWQAVNSNEIVNTQRFVAASGGTVTCTGDFKIHTFTGPGTLEVTCAGTASGSNTLEYLVIAGGGSGGSSANGPNYRGGGGGGAGGYRESSGTTAGSYTISPLGACVSAITASLTSYPITVGGGGAGSCNANNEGTPSVFSTITSAGGGGGGRDSANPASGAGCGGQADNGGSGGGAAAAAPGLKVKGAGNTPPVSPSQGQDGGGPNTGTGGCSCNGSGGGGATVAGTKATGPSAGAGGTGATSSINNSPTTRAGGGVGGTNGPNSAGSPAPANSGGGGGGANGGPSDTGGGSGGSGIVIIRYKYQ